MNSKSKNSKHFFGMYGFFAVVISIGVVCAEEIEKKPNRCRGKNEVFNKCSLLCEKNCENLYTYDRKKCEDQRCIARCECEPGFYRNKKGECVCEEECPTNEIRCPSNQVLSQNKTVCQDTCKYIVPGAPKRPCAEGFFQGCVCEPGYVIDDISRSGQCIRYQDCPYKTQPCKDRNEQFSDEGADCKTCTNPLWSCPKVKGYACYCRKGYIRDNMDKNKCVKPNKCSQIECDGDNEIFNECSPTTPISCENMYLTTTSDGGCVPRCDCAPGTVRNKDNECVLQTDCPPDEIKCPKNQVLTSEKTSCQDTCYYILPTSPKRPCNRITFQGCVCEPGYVIDDLGGTKLCIPVIDCPYKTSPCADPNEIFNSYGRDCRTCLYPKQQCEVQYRYKCYCKNGYIRDEFKNGTCVQPKDCSNLC